METQDIKITVTFPDTSKDTKQYNCKDAHDVTAEEILIDGITIRDYVESLIKVNHKDFKGEGQFYQCFTDDIMNLIDEVLHDFTRQSLRDELIKFAKEFNKNCESVFIEDEFINLYLNSKGSETKG